MTLNTKKILALLACSTFFISGCGGDDAPKSNESSSSSTVVTDDGTASVKATVYYAKDSEQIFKLVEDSNLTKGEKELFREFSHGTSISKYEGKTVEEIISAAKEMKNALEKQLDEEKKRAEIASNGTKANIKINSIIKTKASSFNDPLTPDVEGCNCLFDYNIINNSDKTIVGLQADVIVLNDFEDEVNVIQMEDTGISIPPGNTAGRRYLMTTYFDHSISNIRGTQLNGQIIITKVLYADKSLEKGKEPSKANKNDNKK